MRGQPFQMGNKLGPGRPRGSRNKTTVFLEALEKNGVALIQQCQALAFKGDVTALRLCIERLVPVAKAANSRFRLPPVGTTEELAKALPALVKAVARGQLSAQEGEAIASMLDSQRKAIEAQEFAARLQALEQAAERVREPNRSGSRRNGA